MEKDYFKDRAIEATIRNKLINGADVYICLKEAQKYAKEINDLTRVTITRHLTSQAEHPRGCKVKGNHFETNKYGHLKMVNNDTIMTECVGRCTYLVNDDNSILTSEGNKLIVRNEDKYHLELKDTLANYYKVFLLLQIQDSDLFLEVDVDNYSFFKEKDEAIEYTKNIAVGNNFVLNGRCLYGDLFNEQMAIDKFNMVHNNKYIVIPSAKFYSFIKEINPSGIVNLIPIEFNILKCEVPFAINKSSSE